MLPAAQHNGCISSFFAVIVVAVVADNKFSLTVYTLMQIRFSFSTSFSVGRSVGYYTLLNNFVLTQWHTITFHTHFAIYRKL